MNSPIRSQARAQSLGHRLDSLAGHRRDEARKAEAEGDGSGPRENRRGHKGQLILLARVDRGHFIRRELRPVLQFARGFGAFQRQGAHADAIFPLAHHAQRIAQGGFGCCLQRRPGTSDPCGNFRLVLPRMKHAANRRIRRNGQGLGGVPIDMRQRSRALINVNFIAEQPVGRAHHIECVGQQAHLRTGDLHDQRRCQRCLRDARQRGAKHIGLAGSAIDISRLCQRGEQAVASGAAQPQRFGDLGQREGLRGMARHEVEHGNRAGHRRR